MSACSIVAFYPNTHLGENGGNSLSLLKVSLNGLAPVNVYVRRCLGVLVCVQSALRVATPLVLLDGHTWLVLELSHGGMGSPFNCCCGRYYGL